MKIKTTIKFPLYSGYDFPCKVTIESEFKGGRPSEFDLQNRWFVNEVAEVISKRCDFKNIKIEEEKEGSMYE